MFAFWEKLKSLFHFFDCVVGGGGLRFLLITYCRINAMPIVYIQALPKLLSRRDVVLGDLSDWADRPITGEVDEVLTALIVHLGGVLAAFGPGSEHSVVAPGRGGLFHFGSRNFY